MRRESKVMFLVIAILCGLVFSSTPTEATVITIEIEAEIDFLADPSNIFEDSLKVGDMITGSYTYDSDTPDSAPEDWLGKYEYSQAPYGMILEVGDFRFETDPEDVDFIIYVSNDRLSPKGDIWSIVSKNNLLLDYGLSIGWMYWQLNDRSGEVVSSTNLPLTGPILADWQDGNSLRAEGVLRQTDFIIDAHVNSAIPEPATIILLVMGGLFLRKRS